MKKIISILVLFICLFSLTSCFNGGLTKPRTGRRVREITLTKTNNETITINKKTDPYLLYQIIEELYDNDYCFEYYGSFSIKTKDISKKTYRGLYVKHEDLTYKTHINKYKKINRFSFMENNQHDIIDLCTLKDQPIYGFSVHNNLRYAFVNNGEEVRPQYPSYADMTDKDSKEICDYLNHADIFQSIFLREGFLGGLYIEKLRDKFEYKFTLTKNYIIFSVKQPYGIPGNSLPYEAITPNGKFVKKIYFNINTFQIDYVKTKANIYNNLIFLGIETKYSYVLSRVEMNFINSQIEQLKQYTKENAVLSNKN